MQDKKILKELLKMFWLRPETALWRAVDIMTMKDFKFESPSIDIGCGDGIFSFTRAGGQVEPDYKFFQHEDIYNSFNENMIRPTIKKLPNYKIDVGFDHKENLLKKAELLGLYNKTVCGDANKKLPFEDESFKTIFSDIIYWLDDPVAVFKELKRILLSL